MVVLTVCTGWGTPPDYYQFDSWLALGLWIRRMIRKNKPPKHRKVYFANARGRVVFFEGPADPACGAPE